MQTKEDPLNPDDEQRLFEKLSWTEEDFNMMEYIRHDMRMLRKLEQSIKLEKTE